jgi:hypothetical protein
MGIYYLILFILVLLCVADYRKHKPIYFIIGGMVLLIIAGFRNSEIGIDLESYISSFVNRSEGVGNKANIELLWTYLNHVLYLISNNERWFIFATSILTLFPIFLFISKESKQPLFSLLLLFLIQSGFCFFMTGIRQSMALAVVIWAFYFFKDKKYLISAGLIVLATGIHATAFFCLLYFAFSLLKIGKSQLKIVLLFSVAVGFLFRVDIFSIFDKLSLIFTAFSFYGSYSDYYIEMIPNFIGLLFTIVPQSIFAYYAVDRDRDNFYTKLFLWGTVLTNIFASTPSIPRYFIYLVFFQIIVIPNNFKQLSMPKKVIILSTVLLLVVYFFHGVPVTTGTDNYHFNKF